MKRFIVLIIVLSVALPVLGSEEHKLDELTGVLKKNAKALSSCLLQIDGSYSIGLRGDILNTIPDGTQIWVKGKLHTLFYDNSGDATPAMPSQWHIFMEVKDCKKISKSYERPIQSIDQEVKLTLRNGKMKRTLGMTESELSFNRLAELCGMMGYQVSCSTRGDNWSISRKDYVSPELPDDLSNFFALFTKAVIDTETTTLSKFFALTTYFPSNKNPGKHDHITNLEAARRFLQNYAADEIVVCNKGLGVEGQETLLLAGDSKTSKTKEWFLLLWIVKRDGDRVITQINEMSDFWLYGYKKK